MATQRYISTSFWDDKWIMELNPSEKFLYMYLLTNPLTNIAGIYKITKNRISFDSGFEISTVEEIIMRFEKDRKAFHYNNEFVILPTWPKHQQFEKRIKIKTGIEAVLKELPKNVLNFAAEVGYRYPIDTISIPYKYDTNYIDSEFDNDINREREKALEKYFSPLKNVKVEKYVKIITEEYYKRLNKRLNITSSPTTKEKLLALKIYRDCKDLDLIIRCLDVFFDDSINWIYTRKSKNEPDIRVYRFKTFCTVINDMISYIRSGKFDKKPVLLPQYPDKSCKADIKLVKSKFDNLKKKIGKIGKAG